MARYYVTMLVFVGHSIISSAVTLPFIREYHIVATPLRCHPKKTGAGLDGKRCNATKTSERFKPGCKFTKSTVGEIQARLQNGKVHKPNDAIL